MNPTHKVYVYGTLRPGGTPEHLVPGVLYDISWFPGIQLVDGHTDSRRVVCEVLEVDDNRLAGLDRYEGYYENDHERSLYLRVPFEDGWIYVYNQSFDGKTVIESGDWVKHVNQKEETSCT